MSTRSTKMLVSLFALATGIALVMPATAEPAKQEKPKQQSSATQNTQPRTAYRGTDKFRAGPLYFQDMYLGDDPDPFIRLMIQRDIGARFPGSD